MQLLKMILESSQSKRLELKLFLQATPKMISKLPNSNTFITKAELITPNFLVILLKEYGTDHVILI